MEHLLTELPSSVESARTKPSPLAIPYLADEYDGSGDFLAYPSHRGWDISTWSWVENEDDGFDQNGRTMEEMSAFLQTWLYFGLLKVFLGPSLEFDQTKFKRWVGGGGGSDGEVAMGIEGDGEGEWMLCTEALVECVERRQEQLNEMPEEERKAEEEMFSEARAKTDAVVGGLNFVLFYGKRGQEEETVILQKCLLGVRLLLELLWRVDGDGNRKVPGELFYDLHLRRLLLEDRWCPFTVEFLQSKVPLQLQACALSLGSVRLRQDHKTCTIESSSKGCASLQAGADFVTKHANAGCQCPHVYSPIDEVVSMLRDGMIPVLAITTNEVTGDIELLVDGLELENDEFRNHAPFVSFTHVWANGLGNPDANSLPTCQILRLKEIQSHLLKRNALVEILSECFETTAWENGTISFWLDTLCIPVRPEHQDWRDFSINKMRDVYRKAAGVVMLDPDTIHLSASTSSLEIMIKSLISGWNSRLWTYQEAALTNELYLAAEGTCFNLCELDERLSEELLGKTAVYRQLVWTAWHVFEDLVHDSLAGFCTTTSPGLALQRMLRAASHRNTSRSADETVCLATFLNLDVATILSLPTIDRMPAFLAQLPSIPPQILFARGRHIDRPGFQWAPQSFLAPNGVQDYLDIRYPKTYIDEHGESRDVPKPVLHPNRLGLSIFVSAVKFYRTRPTTSDLFNIRTSDSGSYQCEVRDSGSFTDWRGGDSRAENEGTGHQMLVVLLMDLQHQRCDLGILARVMPMDQHRDIQLCHWLRIVEVLDSDRDRGLWVTAPDLAEYEGTFVPFREWIVD